MKLQTKSNDSKQSKGDGKGRAKKKMEKKREERNSEYQPPIPPSRRHTTTTITNRKRTRISTTIAPHDKMCTSHNTTKEDCQ